MEPNQSRTSVVEGRDLSASVKVRIMSSANKLILCCDPAISTPLIPTCDLMASARGSKQILMVIWGIPVIIKNFNSTPLVRTLAEGVVYRALIAEKNATVKAKFLMYFKYKTPKDSVECFFCVYREKKCQDFLLFYMR